MAKYHDIGIRIDAPEELLAGPDEEITPEPEPLHPESAVVTDGILASSGSPGDSLET